MIAIKLLIPIAMNPVTFMTPSRKGTRLITLVKLRESKTETENRLTGFELNTENRFLNLDKTGFQRIFFFCLFWPNLSPTIANIFVICILPLHFFAKIVKTNIFTDLGSLFCTFYERLFTRNFE